METIKAFWAQMARIMATNNYLDMRLKLLSVGHVLETQMYRWAIQRQLSLSSL